MDTFRLGPHENFDSCVRWLNHEGMHIMGYGDWKLSEEIWWGGTFIAYTRKAFLAMIHRMRAEPPMRKPTDYIDMWWKSLGKTWNSSSEDLKQYIHPERGGPHVRKSTTLVRKDDADDASATLQQPVKTVNFGGSLNPDGRDPHGGMVLLETGPPAYVQWYGQHGHKVGRQFRRFTFLSPEDRMEDNSEKGPTAPGLWLWSPPMKLGSDFKSESFETVAVPLSESVRAAVFKGTRQLAEYRKWTTSPWKLAQPWALTLSHEATFPHASISLSMGIAGIVTSLPTAREGKFPLLQKCKKDMPLFHAMLEAANSVHGGTPTVDAALALEDGSQQHKGAASSCSASVAVKGELMDEYHKQQQFHNAIQSITSQLGSDQIKRMEEKRRRCAAESSGEPEVSLIGAIQMLEPPEWEDWRESFPSRLPDWIHLEDARFVEKRLAGDQDKTCKTIRCDCDGCLSDAEMEASMTQAREYQQEGSWEPLAELLMDACCSLRKRLFNDEDALYFKLSLIHI